MSTPDAVIADSPYLGRPREIELVGLAWDDPRGYGPLEAVEGALAAADRTRAIRVRWDIQPLAGFESRSIDELAQQYDLIVMDHPHTAAACAAACLTPVGPFDDSYVGAARDCYLLDGEQWAAPVDASCHVAAWGSEIDGDRLTTWDEVFAAADRGLRVAAPLAGVHSLMALLSLLASYGLEPTIDFTSQPEMTPALTTLRRLAACCPAALDWNPIEALHAVGSGQVDYLPCTFGYAHFVNQGVSFGRMPAALPGRPSRAILGGAGLAVSARSRQPDAAVRFARLAASAAVQRTIWPEHGGQPAHREAWDVLASEQAFYRVARSAIETAFVRPIHPEWNRFQIEAGTAIEGYLRSPESDVSTIIKQLQSLAAATLQ